MHPPKRTVTPAQEIQIVDFLTDRARYIFREKEAYAYDEVAAVFRSGSDDVVDAQKRLAALKAVRKSKNFEPLAISFKRVRRILEKANLTTGSQPQVRTELFENDAERELYRAMREAAAKVQASKRSGKYQDALDTIAGLRKPLDQFFVDVMVMAENAAVRANRLALLSDLLKEFTTVADFSEMGGDEKLGR